MVKDEMNNIDHDATRMERTRKNLALSPELRQRAVARFPILVNSLARHLEHLYNMQDQGELIDDNTRQLMKHLETRICDCYREIFGTELGHDTSKVKELERLLENIISASYAHSVIIAAQNSLHKTIMKADNFLNQ